MGYSVTNVICVYIILADTCHWRTRQIQRLSPLHVAPSGEFKTIPVLEIK